VEKVVISEEARQRLVMEQLAKHAMSKVEEEKKLKDDHIDEKLENEETTHSDSDEENRVELGSQQKEG
jgi:hypothetical protein